MRLTLTLPHHCAVHHGPDGLVIELPDAAVGDLAAQIGSGQRLTVDDVCRRYQVSRPTVASWERAGLQPIVLGRTKFYSEEELRRFERHQTEQRTNPANLLNGDRP